ncbi:ABC transporter ATP-binding protein [Flavivirga aquatica]|uniref:ABC transporter ATP-binding protein n=1 Tax=Flavivirga aquatica TaxID=1849968 RepID=A0A1E5TBV2_9FLAO|nr:ABC transporter ATP-binding protein [Flavivirga aquatica]OEK08836.1 ABC transporter ATP-binding protein [Flavivirga aquatica]
MGKKDIILKAENISKQYRLGLVGTGTIGADLNRWWHSIRGKEDPYLKIGESNDRSTKGESNYVWALNDINFEVERGEVLGIIGKNGAGKSTLLKILSKVTSPTTGEIKTKGRIASLLEVGTGFHGEMTGRENIFLNGAILGMTKKEIKSKIDEIIDFSGCERYIDTPVKRYSSGMTVRLAFAVAAFLEPEILVVDEVLAVGDAEFQKKAIGKMQDISKGEGRTVLFVSHNMQSISSLTNRCIVLEKGNKIFDGNTSDSIDFYLKNNKVTEENDYKAEPIKDLPNILGVSVKTSNVSKVHIFGEPLEISFRLNVPFSLKGASLSFQIVDKHESPILHMWTFDSEKEMCRKPGVWKLKCVIPKLRLYMGDYTLKVYFTGPPGGEKYDIIEGVCPFKVEMFKIYREFEFRPNTCKYIEDSNWLINQE